MTPHSHHTSHLARKLTAGLSILAALLLASALQAAQEPERDSVKLLTIGNSFANDALSRLSSIAEAGGKTLLVGRANIGGCSLERHARHLNEALEGNPDGHAYTSFRHPETGKNPGHTSLPEALQAFDWDIVTIQQVSHQSFRPESFQPHADQLIEAIRLYAPQAEIVIHQTWAYRTDHAFFRKDDGFTQEKMYDGLRDTYHQLAEATGFRILPSGDAMQLARQSPRWQYQRDPNFDFQNPPAGQLPDQSGSLMVGWKTGTDKEGNPKLSLDAIHANAAGRYLASCVWYLVLFNADEVPSGYQPNDLSTEQAADLREIARQAVEAERQRTQS